MRLMRLSKARHKRLEEALNCLAVAYELDAKPLDPVQEPHKPFIKTAQQIYAFRNLVHRAKYVTLEFEDE